MNRLLVRVVGSFLILLLSCTTPLLAQQTSTSQQTPTPPTSLPPPELPENPGQSVAPAQNQSQPAPAPAPAEQISNQPSGTAVAPPVELSGGAASKPAGVALAPPKQRQIHSLLIKLGVLAGAGVALGTVVGLSAASPSHVPNSPGH